MIISFNDYWFSLQLKRDFIIQSIIFFSLYLEHSTPSHSVPLMLFLVIR